MSKRVHAEFHDLTRLDRVLVLNPNAVMFRVTTLGWSRQYPTLFGFIDNPKKLNLNQSTLVQMALSKAFPCLKKK